MKIFMNGKIVNEDQAVISVFDHGFLYGYGLFETIRAYGGHPFLLQDHYERLKRSAESYHIKMNKTYDQLQNDIYQTLRANGLRDAYIRITLSGGAKGLGLWGKEHDEPVWIIMTKPLGALPEVKSLVTLSLNRSTQEGNFRTKSLSFANNMLAKKELEQRSHFSAEGIFLTREGHVVEGTVSNLFFVRDGKVYTPHEDTGLLPGVIREFIIRSCHEAGIQVLEGWYGVEELQSAEEVFLTNSIQEIVAADQIDGVSLPIIRGPVTERLIHSYQTAIRKLGPDGHK